jgi:hypothetical protein
MASYKLLKIRVYTEPANINIECTDVNSIAWIVPKIRQIIPSCKEQHTPFWLKIDKLMNRDDEIRWLVLRWLTEDGWEPFSVIGNPSGGELNYYFRKESSNN